ncbi:MAG: metalloregulator ArsR/SmtB family transcription factor [Actinomycetota bacterium]|nr:metalloregulator ArsR/SmtB family transcription factor [Actinomycetota bacterium]
MPSGREDAALGSAAALFRCLGDRCRLAIVCHLALGEHNVRDLTEHLGPAQATVSAHLRCLRDCGMVTVRARAATGDAVTLCPGYGAPAQL